MGTLIEQILELKTAAKNQRDRGLRGYPGALKRLESAIALAAEGLAQTTVADLGRQFAKELADCHGMTGGVQRRWALEGDAGERDAHLGASCIAYDAGHGYEWDPRFDIRASYNLVNRLTGRLLLRPDLLDSNAAESPGFGVAALNIPVELGLAIAAIEQHLARKSNFWAEADLALLKVLLGQADAPAAYAPFQELAPPAFAYSSALDALRPLAALPLKTAPALAGAVALLEAACAVRS